MSGLDKINFTKRVLEEIAPPSEGRLYFRDSKTRGLLLTVYPTGRKVFSLYRKVDGHPERMMIGPFPDWSVERARGKARGSPEGKWRDTLIRSVPSILESASCRSALFSASQAISYSPARSNLH